MLQPTLTDLHDEATWLEWRALAIPSLLPMLPEDQWVTTEQTRAEFLYGAKLLRLDQRERIDKSIGPTPIQLVIADVLNAGWFLNAVMEPRRTSKTTSIECMLLGRCHHREDYQVGMTLATHGYKASERFKKDILAHLDRLYPNKQALAAMGMKVDRGKGTEHIAWDNGSFFNVYTPNGDGFRSGGFDVGWVDEAGEAEPELGIDLTVAVLPTMDTKPGAQFIVSGTAPAYRDGNLLYDNLNDTEVAVCQHGVPDTTDPEELEDWGPSEEHPRARVRELVLLSHPGIPRSTPLESVERNYRKFRAIPGKFEAEYLGIPGAEGSATGLIPTAQRERAALDLDMPGPPARFTLAMSVHPDGLWASLVAAWIYEEPADLVSTALTLAGQPEPEKIHRVAIALLHHQQGVQGFANRVLAFARKFRVPIIYDQLSQAAGVEVEILTRAAPRPALQPATTVDVRRAATKTVKRFEEGSIVYFRTQRPMDNALEIAVKRAIGAAGGFGFGRPKGEYAADITPIEGGSLALHFLDDAPQTTKPADAMHF
jgi:hypothetical protein